MVRLKDFGQQSQEFPTVVTRVLKSRARGGTQLTWQSTRLLNETLGSFTKTMNLQCKWSSVYSATVN